MSAAPVLVPAGHRADFDPTETMESRTRVVAARFRGVMEALGLDLDDPNLADTPARVARAYRFLFSGLEAGAEPELRTFPNAEGYSGIVAVTGIRFHSLCAHHFLPFFGTAHVAYLPKERLVGLSKLARAVELFARRPQVQERLTEEIASFLDSRLEPGCDGRGRGSALLHGDARRPQGRRADDDELRARRLRRRADASGVPGADRGVR